MTDSIQEKSNDKNEVQVVCTECLFRTLVDKATEMPADVVIRHGRETGHTLAISPDGE